MASEKTGRKPKYIAVSYLGTFIRVSNLERSEDEIKKEIEEAAALTKKLVAQINLPCDDSHKK